MTIYTDLVRGARLAVVTISSPNSRVLDLKVDIGDAKHAAVTLAFTEKGIEIQVRDEADHSVVRTLITLKEGP